MKCAVHSDVDAVGYCRNCGKAMCSACVRPVRDVLYCEDCLATIMGIPGAAPAAIPGAEMPGASAAPPSPAAVPARSVSSPGIAFVLGLFPGLGAVYNGEYNKALIHIVVFAAMIWGLNSDMGDSADVLLSLLLAGFILYMGFDAMRTARAKNFGEQRIDPLEALTKNRPVGPIILIVLGALFLLNNFTWFSFYRVGRVAWPLILIGVGVLMFRNRLDRS
jgi:cell wall-active antibiotic response 4TMS protein YvqF